AAGSAARSVASMATGRPRLCDRFDDRLEVDVVDVARLVLVLVLDRGDKVAVDAEDLVDAVLDLLGDLRVFLQERLGGVAPLAQAFLAIGEERARLLDDVVLEAEVDQAALGRDAAAELDVELGLAERRRDLVLDDLDPHAVADRLGAVLERLDAADVEALG